MGLINTIITYPGTRTNNTTTVNIYVDVVKDNETDYAIDVYCTAIMKSGYYVQSAGLMFYSSATGHNMQGPSSICGNTFANEGDGHKEYGGTTYTSIKHSYSWKKSTDMQNINVFIDIHRSSDLISHAVVGHGKTSVTIGRKKVWNNINAYRADDNQENGASFDLSIYNSDTGQWTEYFDIPNEPASFFYPYGSFMEVYNIRPIAEYADTWEIDKVTGYDSRFVDPYDPTARKDGRYRDPEGYTVFCNTINGDNSKIEIYTRWKRSDIKFYADLEDSNEEPTETITISYNQDVNTAPIPARLGYKFHGWYTEKDRKGNKIYDENGNAIKGTAYWDTNGKCTIKNNLNLYAGWEIQNVAFVKTDADKWKLAMIYVKASDAEWRPAIMYVKTSDTEWTQSGI